MLLPKVYQIVVWGYLISVDQIGCPSGAGPENGANVRKSIVQGYGEDATDEFVEIETENVDPDLVVVDPPAKKLRGNRRGGKSERNLVEFSNFPQQPDNDTFVGIAKGDDSKELVATTTQKIVTEREMRYNYLNGKKVLLVKERVKELKEYKKKDIIFDSFDAHNSKEDTNAQFWNNKNAEFGFEKTFGYMPRYRDEISWVNVMRAQRGWFLPGTHD